jgi:hypothetical protein
LYFRQERVTPMRENRTEREKQERNVNEPRICKEMEATWRTEVVFPADVFVIITSGTEASRQMCL